MTQVLYSRVLGPLTDVAFWAVPALLVVAVGVEAARAVRARRDHRDAIEAEWRRDTRLSLAGACAGTALAHAPVLTYRWVHLGMLVVLPTLGAAVGLVVGGLLPTADRGTHRVAELDRRRVASYVSSRPRWMFWGACGFSFVVAGWRFVLPAETPLPDAVVEQLGGQPIVSPTKAVYVVAVLCGAALTAIAWAAASAVVRRARPASDAASLARRDGARRATVGRLVAWTTASLLLLDAALLAPLPQKMGGVVFGDVQLIQRATDALIVAFVVAAAFVAGRSQLRSAPDAGGATL